MATVFISYYPLKQGLKLYRDEEYHDNTKEFISYYPLKQGLKHTLRFEHEARHRYLYPTIH